jgi:PAS domain S-box-containing protein
MAKVEKSNEKLSAEIELLRQQLQEAKDTIEAIKNGEIDALVVQGRNGHELFTLKSADHTYRIFIEKMTEGAVTLNSEGVIIYHNSSFASMVGKPSDRLLSENFEQHVHPADRETYRTLIRDGWNADIIGEISLIQDRRIVPAQLSIASLKIGEASSLSIIVTDLTNQKENMRQLKLKNDELERMNAALELSNNDLQQFASVASHDLQEPLRKIQIFSTQLQEKFTTELSDMPREYIHKIMAAASRMKVLIVDILNYSRLSAKDNQFEKTDLNLMIAELMDDMELSIKEKNATVRVSKIPVVEVNPGQMRQVLQNLLSNALKFSRKRTPPVIEIFPGEAPPGTSTVIPFSSERYCHLHIKDNGIGFETKYAKSIFNLFEKLHSKDDYEGSGIGLAIAKKIIEKHHGDIKVISKIGEGTEFIVSLPFIQNER